ncbi:MAG: hypothetical protein NVS3B1_06020 [Marmoricola sp.]
MADTKITTAGDGSYQEMDASEADGAQAPVASPVGLDAGTPPPVDAWPTVPHESMVTPPNRVSQPGQPGYSVVDAGTTP